MNDLAVKVMCAPLGKTSLFFAGQAGFILKSKEGTILGIDLYLSNCVERVEGHVGFKRLVPAPLTPSEIRFDYLIATHSHYDHFDMDAIPEMMSNHHTKLLASQNCKAEVKRLMMPAENITYAKVGDSYEADDIHISCVFCDHGKGAPDAFGLVIESDGKKIFIAGDTCLHLEKAEDFRAKGPFDIMIAPINGAYGNLNESECAALAHTLQPKLTIPCHFGMFASHGGNPGLFREIMVQQYPENSFLLMSIGEQITFTDKGDSLL